MVEGTDGELEVGIKLDEQAVREVEQTELNVTGEGEEGLSPSQQQEQQQVVSGGFRTALKATGLLALISQLTPITGTLSAILGTLGRSLVPAVEVVGDLLRPFTEFANELVQGKQSATSTARSAGQAIIPSLATGGSLLPGFGTQQFEDREAIQQSVTNDPGAQAIQSLIDRILSAADGPKPDQSGEANKMDLKDQLEEPLNDILGGGR